MEDIKPCPKCKGTMYAIKGMIALGMAPPNPSKQKDWFCGRCRHNERS